jgi:hypothetical protein
MLQRARLRRWGGWTAAFALWLQLVLSAGHMHAEDLRAGSRLDGPSLSAAIAGTSAAGPEFDPEHDGCAICVTMYMVATAVPPPLLQAAPPGLMPGSFALPVPQLLPEAAPFRLFQSRAPPFV